jgi:heat shock protein HslJ
LAGTEWQLVGYGPAESPMTPTPGSAPTLAFDEAGQLSGFAGCNRYFGPYTLESEAFAAGPLGSTKMACANEGAMRLETDYLAALGAAHTLKLDGDALTITYPDGVLRFERGLSPSAPDVTPTLPPFGAPLENLVGTEWRLVGYGPAEALAAPVGSTLITLVFRSETELGGSGGCNSYFGSYALQGETFTVTGVGSTEMACLEEGVMAQESAYLQQLSAGGLLTQSGDELTLTNASGVLIFERVLPPPPAAFEGTLWRLEAFVQGEAVASPLAGVEISVTFSEGKASGFSGCNWFSAEYKVDGSTLELGLIQQTVRACLEPGVEDQERAFAEAFRTVNTFSVENDRLTLTHEGGVLHFRASR